MAINAKLVSLDGNEYRVEDTASTVFDSLVHKLLGGIMVFLNVSDAVAMSTQMTHLTNHDHLTGLPNRVLLHDRMLQAINAIGNTNKKVALLLITWITFKYLNDSLGHQVGDNVITHIARRLESFAQYRATVSRIGGDEFVMLIPACDHLWYINQLAEKVKDGIRAPLVINEEELRLSVSMGVSVCPLDAATPEELISHADTAMYKVKNTSKNGYTYYSDELFNGMKERLITEKLIHKRLNERGRRVFSA